MYLNCQQCCLHAISYSFIKLALFYSNTKYALYTVTVLMY